MARAIHSRARQLSLEQRQGARLEGRSAMAGESLASRTRQHQHTTPQLPCLYVTMHCVLTLALSHPLPPPLFFFFFFSFAFFRDCALRAKSLSSLVTIRRTDERRTQTLTRDQRNGIRDLALLPFLRTLSSFYVRFMRYVSVLHLTLTSLRFRDERRQRGERATYARTSRPPPYAVEEPPSRSRAVFHPSSSFHYPILWAFSCHSYHHHLRSTFHFCTRSTFPLVGCFALARADSMTAFDDQT